MESLALFNLPRELILQILDPLSRSDVLSLSLVNKATYTTTEPLLWSDITLAWKENHPPRLDLLLQTLFEKSHLSSYTLHLALKGLRFFTWGDTDAAPKLSVKSLPQDVAASFIQSTTLEPALKENWIQELKLGTPDALATLFIALLPSLTSLYLGRTFTTYNVILGHVFRHQLCQDQSLPHEVKPLLLSRSLRRVVFLPRNPRGGDIWHRNTPDVLPFFHLPNLEHISVTIDNAFAFVWPGGVPSLKNLLSLSLYGLREHFLQYVLEPLENLQALTWHFYNYGERFLSEQVIDLDTMGVALRCVSKTVTGLTISACDDSEVYEDEPIGPELWVQGSLDGLREFEKLQKLKIPWVFLMGFEPGERRELLHCMPRNLETLELTNDLEEAVTFKVGELSELSNRTYRRCN